MSKKNKIKIEPKAEAKKEFPKYLNHVVLLLLFLIFSISLYLRAVIPFNNGFADGLYGFAIDDAVFQMRLVEHTIANFPTRIYYDAFTQYPYGNSLHWGPMFTQAIALLAIIGGYIFDGGFPPSEHTINTVGMIFPTILGALVVFPTYFIIRELIGIKAALIGSLIVAIMPGQFLSRSLLGFTDTHVAEVLFLTLTMCFFIISIKNPEKKIYAILSGISLGSYLLNWTAGIFFVAVLIIFIVIQSIIDKWKNKDSTYLMTSSITFAITLLMILPAVKISNGFDSAYYSMAHVSVLSLGIIVSVLLVTISKKISTLKHYLICLGILSMLAIVFVRLLIPNFFNFIIDAAAFAFNPRIGGQLTVAEVTPTCGSTSVSILSMFNCPRAVYEFGYNYYISMLGFIMLLYYSLKTGKPKYMLVLIWSIIVLVITLMQNRFTYYYAINIAILSAFVIGYILNLAQFNKILNIKDIKIHHVALILMLISITVLPIVGSSLIQAPGGSKHAGFYEWHEAMTWMKYNTPDPELDYFAIYEQPAKNIPYSYPDTAYGVMSWWDYGHMITYWAHRIPVSNPFQTAIGGGGEHEPGASTFLTAQTETESLKVLDAFGKNLNVTGVKYVITDAYMAYSIQDIFTIWNFDEYQQGPDPKIYWSSYVRTNNGVIPIPGLKQFTSMTGRLHIMDGNGLQHYRLIHESPPAPALLRGRSKYEDSELAYKEIAIRFYGINIPQIHSGYVKIFEIVKGAHIIGKTLPNTVVNLMASMSTNTNRSLTYSQTNISSVTGSYEFVVPYALTYTITSKNTTQQITVTEKAVTEGQSIKVL